ncbi:hypothetical protein X274_06375 [Marinitoga sp. 1155]|nr:hypothetical protein X274_06375 [Marinitoga sp. 1155]
MVIISHTLDNKLVFRECNEERVDLNILKKEITTLFTEIKNIEKASVVISKGLIIFNLYTKIRVNKKLAFQYTVAYLLKKQNTASIFYQKCQEKSS